MQFAWLRKNCCLEHTLFATRYLVSRKIFSVCSRITVFFGQKLSLERFERSLETYCLLITYHLNKCRFGRTVLKKYRLGSNTVIKEYRLAGV